MTASSHTSWYAIPAGVTSACRRSTSPFEPNLFVCQLCGHRAEIKHVADAPSDYAYDTRTGPRLSRSNLFRWPTRCAAVSFPSSEPSRHAQSAQFSLLGPLRTRKEPASEAGSLLTP
jgi:hypothetical protein